VVKAIELKSKIKCPECGFEKEEPMYMDRTQYFYKCSGCEWLIQPEEGGCCVFCSFGTIECPQKQTEKTK
jgi:rubredoxin